MWTGLKTRFLIMATVRMTACLLVFIYPSLPGQAKEFGMVPHKVGAEAQALGTIFTHREIKITSLEKHGKDRL